MTAQARTLDIIVCGITPAKGFTTERVHYGFPVGEARIEYANIYPEGKFDLSTIEIGKRYVVKTRSMNCLAWDHAAQQYTYQSKFVWVKATEVNPDAVLAARTKKQRKNAEGLAAVPLVDDGELFSW